MNYYFDTEFIEDFCISHYANWPFNIRAKKLHYISMISIGIVAEDGREYYAVSKDFDLKHVWHKHDLQLQEMGDAPKKIYWLRENVLRPIHQDLYKNISGDMKNTDYFNSLSEFNYRNLKRLIGMYGKTNQEIAADITVFTAGAKMSNQYMTMATEEYKKVAQINYENPPVFYAYYADYDWVVFCSLFGRMLYLPKGYPMYCRDLKQMMDEFGLNSIWKERYVPGDNEHHALADARWDKRLHEEIKRHKVLQQYPTMPDKPKSVS